MITRAYGAGALGLTLFGIGAAFWGLVAGVVANLVFSRIRK